MRKFAMTSILYELTGKPNSLEAVHSTIRSFHQRPRSDDDEKKRRGGEFNKLCGELMEREKRVQRYHQAV